MNKTGRWLATWICLTASAAIAEPEPPVSPPDAAGLSAATPPRTVITLGFDDGRSTQPAVLPLLAELGMRASFFVNSGNIGTTSGYLDWPALAAIQAAGHELGGHTVDHEDLTLLTREEVLHQVCDDRAALVAAGLGSPISFAYPGGAADAEVAAILADCGYRYGWSQGGLDKEGCQVACLFAEPAEPPDLLRLRAPLSVDRDWTLKDLQGFVLRAETSGGWLGIAFHHICDDCNYRYRIAPALLREFLVWLAARKERGTVVLPLGEAFAPVPPEPPVPPDPPSPLPGRPAARPDVGPTPDSPDGPATGSSTGCSIAPAASGASLLPLALALAVLLARRSRRPRPLGPGTAPGHVPA